MSLKILILMSIVVILVIVIRFFIKLRKRKKAQQDLDMDIEQRIRNCNLFTVSIGEFAEHSKKEKMAEIFAIRMKNYIALHPSRPCVMKIFHNLGLFSISINNWTSREIEFAALIQQYFLRIIDPDKLRMHKEIFQDFEEFKKIFPDPVLN